MTLLNQDAASAWSATGESTLTYSQQVGYGTSRVFSGPEANRKLRKLILGVDSEGGIQPKRQNRFGWNANGCALRHDLSARSRSGA